MSGCHRLKYYRNYQIKNVYIVHDITHNKGPKWYDKQKNKKQKNQI